MVRLMYSLVKVSAQTLSGGCLRCLAAAIDNYRQKNYRASLSLEHVLLVVQKTKQRKLV